MATLKETLERLTAEGEILVREDGKIRCLACGHRCRIPEGHAGICKVRYVKDDKLLVPTGYVGAIHCDPVEKKPFFHALPGSQALTFGMLGCDLHCAYCFTGDTVITTTRGPRAISEIFAASARVITTDDGEIGYPEDVHVVTASGNVRPVRAAFRHDYKGQLLAVRPHYLPALTCTPDHRVYATDDAGRQPTLVPAAQLSPRHFLAVPRHHRFDDRASIDAIEALARKCAPVADHYLVPIREVTSMASQGPVYNLEVHEEHSYLAGFCAVSNCQNWLTSQALRDPEALAPPIVVSASRIVELAREQGARLVVSSYNEPLITSEWAVEVFREARAAGLTTAFVSNGNGTREVLTYLRPWVDLYKVDLKSFRDKSYRALGGLLENVQRTIQMLVEMKFWVEIVTLVIPGFNDTDEELSEMARFLVSVSPDLPWHVTGFHQDYRMTDPDDTPVKTLLRAAAIGREAGLRFVYAGNRPGKVGNLENTYCPACGTLLVERFGFHVLQNKIRDGGCPSCRARIPGVWS